MNGSVTYDSNNLQTYNRSTGIGIITDDIDLDSIADKDISLYGLAHANASTIPFINYPSKTIPITGTIVSDTATNLDTLLDTFRGYFVGQDKNLDIGYKGSTRRYIATVNTLKITRSQDKRYATFAINFICTIPFGVDTSNTTALNASGRTSAVYSDPYTWLGTAPVQLPVITITLTAVSATGSQQLYFGNDDTGQGITITHTGWANGDVVVIDCVNKTVKINGTAVDFTGAFPEFTNASHVMTYADTFTSRTITENVVYSKRYM